jgi:hypothetical protein
MRIRRGYVSRSRFRCDHEGSLEVGVYADCHIQVLEKNPVHDHDNKADETEPKQKHCHPHR